MKRKNPPPPAREKLVTGHPHLIAITGVRRPTPPPRERAGEPESHPPAKPTKPKEPKK